VLTSTAPNVDLGLVQVSSASNPGSGGWTPFSLNFSNCGAPETAYTIQSTFSYTAYDASNPTLIANNGGTASKVGVEMALNDGVTTLASGTAYTLATTTSGVSSYSVPLKARIRAAAGQTPTAGSVKATATFTMAYP
jgi:type 1 fimbria pilin